MMGVRKILLVCALLVLAAVLAGCGGAVDLLTSTPSPGPTETQPAEDPTDQAQLEPTEAKSMARGNVYLDVVEVQVVESASVQLELNLQGNLPTPCHQLKYEVSGVGEGGDIQVEVWSEAPADQECIQVLEPFEESIDLGTAAEGAFSVFVNGEEVDSLDR